MYFSDWCCFLINPRSLIRLFETFSVWTKGTMQTTCHLAATPETCQSSQLSLSPAQAFAFRLSGGKQLLNSVNALSIINWFVTLSQLNQSSVSDGRKWYWKVVWNVEGLLIILLFLHSLSCRTMSSEGKDLPPYNTQGKHKLLELTLP